MQAMIEHNDGKVIVNLTDSHLKWCREHAKNTVAYHNQNGVGEYAHNRLMGAIVGARCEVAVECFLTRLYQTLDTNFKEDISNTDIALKGKGIEVKGLRGDDWYNLKRMIPPKQLKKYIENEVLVIWATTEANNTVMIRGWNYPLDLEKHGIMVTTICDNIWLKDDKLMRSLDTLGSVLHG